jgi:predicted nuclease of predicted toxin-antitoxin system
MSKNTLITVDGKEINITQFGDEDYISLTDIAHGFGDDSLIYSWMRNRNTVEFLGLWEGHNNPHFKGHEFDTFRKEAGLNNFNLTPQKWINATGAIGIRSKSGRYGGGTFAHKDIALEFGAWISPSFRYYLIKEFQRLKAVEGDLNNIEWNVKRVLSKANYRLHTDAVKDYIIPNSNVSKDKEWIIYATEADLLNVALFGFTARQWKEANPELAAKGFNIRDIASINQLIVLSNIESLHSIMIKSGMTPDMRLIELTNIARNQLQQFDKLDIEKSYKRVVEGQYNLLAEHLPDKTTKADKEDQKVSPLRRARMIVEDIKKDELSDFNQKLGQALNFNPKEDKDKSPE